MKARNLENYYYLILCIISFFFSASAAIVRNQETTIAPDLSEDFAKRTYRPILHSENVSKNTNITALKHLATIVENKDEDDEKNARAGCPIGSPNANEVISGIPFPVFIAAFIIGVFWFVIFVILFEHFTGGVADTESGSGYYRSYDGESLGNLIKNVASGFINTSDFNKMSDLILSSISKLY